MASWQVWDFQCIFVTGSASPLITWSPWKKLVPLLAWQCSVQASSATLMWNLALYVISISSNPSSCLFPSDSARRGKQSQQCSRMVVSGSMKIIFSCTPSPCTQIYPKSPSELMVWEFWVSMHILVGIWLAYLPKQRCSLQGVLFMLNIWNCLLYTSMKIISSTVYNWGSFHSFLLTLSLPNCLIVHAGCSCGLWSLYTSLIDYQVSTYLLG